MFPQLGTGSPTPRPKNDKRDLGEDVLRREQRRLRQENPDDLREHVPPQEIRIRRAEAARRHDVVARAGAQHETADQPRRTRPPDHRDDDQNQQEGLRGREVERQRHADRKEQIQPRQREEQLRDSHVDLVDPSAVIAGQRRRSPCQASTTTPRPAARRTARFVRRRAAARTGPGQNRRCRTGRAASGSRCQRGANPSRRAPRAGSGAPRTKNRTGYGRLRSSVNSSTPVGEGIVA